VLDPDGRLEKRTSIRDLAMLQIATIGNRRPFLRDGNLG